MSIWSFCSFRKWINHKQVLSLLLPSQVNLIHVLFFHIPSGSLILVPHIIWRVIQSCSLPLTQIILLILLLELMVYNPLLLDWELSYQHDSYACHLFLVSCSSLIWFMQVSLLTILIAVSHSFIIVACFRILWRINYW